MFWCSANQGRGGPVGVSQWELTLLGLLALGGLREQELGGGLEGVARHQHQLLQLQQLLDVLHTDR